jgi:putative colanic acid biosysnthesis UDP-glucose lipid carrier transferase
MSAISIRPTRSITPVLNHLADSLWLCAGLSGVQWLIGQPINSSTTIACLIGCILMFAIGEVFGIYRPSRGRSANEEITLCTLAWTTTFVAMILIGVFTKQIDSFARSTIALWYIIGGLMLLSSHMSIRALIEWLGKNGYGARRTAIVGANRLGYDIAKNAMQSADSGIKIIGLYDDRNAERRLADDVDLPPFCGNIDLLLEKVRSNEIDTVLIALPMRAEKRIQSLLDQLGNSTASVYIVPDFFVFELLHSRWTHVGGLPVVSVFESPMYGVDGWIKRLLDLTASVVGCILVSPVLIVCALLVRLSSPGPVFFRQKRYGLDGKEILVWKFRSMYTCDNGPVVKQATKNDPRVTPIGRILRRTSLDELPQLFNVIEGSMSLVGPRPHANAHNEHFRKLIRGYMMRHKVKPGITGLAQVEGSRGETDTIEKMEARLALDHRYIREWSLWFDIKILFKTIFVVVKNEAY